MNNEKYTEILKAGENYEFTLKSFNEHKDNIHYIGVLSNKVSIHTVCIFLNI